MGEIKKVQEKGTEEKMDKAMAEIEVRGAFSRMATAGANSYEPSAIDNILKELNEGKIEPEEAVRQAREMEDAKQNYH
jgi:soluble cytochrome b562